MERRYKRRSFLAGMVSGAALLLAPPAMAAKAVPKPRAARGAGIAALAISNALVQMAVGSLNATIYADDFDFR